MAEETVKTIIEVDINAKKAETDFQKATAEIKKLRDETTSFRKEQNDLAKSNQVGSERFNELTDKIAANTANIKANQTVVTASQKAINAQAAEINSTAGAYQRLDAQLQQAKQAAKDMAVVFGVESEQSKAASKAADDLNDKLKSIDKSVGDNTRNVGDYAIATEGLGSAFKNAGGPIGNVANGISGATGAMKAFNLTNPMGWIIMLLPLISKLFGGFKKTEEQGDKMSVVMGKTSSIFKVLINAMKPPVDFLINNVVEAFNMAGKIADKTLGLLSRGLSAIGFSGAAKNVDRFKKSMGDAAAAGGVLAKAQADLAKAQREVTITQLDYQKKAEKLRQLRDDETRSISQRIDSNSKLGKLLNEQAAAELAIANKSLAFANLKIKLEGATTDNLNLQAEARTSIADIQERITGQESEQLANLNSLRKESADAEKARAESVAAKKKEISEAAKVAELKAAEDKKKESEDAMNESIRVMNFELELDRLKNEELIAGKKLTNKELHDLEVKRIEDDRAVKVNELNLRLANEPAKEKEIKDQITLVNQIARTETSKENAAFETAESDRAKTAKATDLQNELAISGENIILQRDLRLAELEADRITEVEAAEKMGADISLIEQKYATFKKKIDKDTLTTKLDLAAGFAGNIATVFGKESKAGKAAAVAETTINTYKSATAAYSSLAGIPIVGPVLGAAAAGAAVASGFKSVKSILATKSGLPGEGGGGSVPSGGSVAAPTSAVSTTAGIISRSTGSAASVGDTTKNAVGAALKENPQQPVLVTSDVTTAMNNQVQLKSSNGL